jgi:hypothetical protein
MGKYRPDSRFRLWSFRVACRWRSNGTTLRAGLFRVLVELQDTEAFRLGQPLLYGYVGRPLGAAVSWLRWQKALPVLMLTLTCLADEFIGKRIKIIHANVQGQYEDLIWIRYVFYSAYATFLPCLSLVIWINPVPHLQTIVDLLLACDPCFMTHLYVRFRRMINLSWAPFAINSPRGVECERTDPIPGLHNRRTRGRSRFSGISRRKSVRTTRFSDRIADIIIQLKTKDYCPFVEFYILHSVLHRGFREYYMRCFSDYILHHAFCELHMRRFSYVTEKWTIL